MKNKSLLMWVLLGLFPLISQAQNDVMMQAFYWNVPTDVTFKKGHWWNNLKDKSSMLKNAGITGIWVPSPAKGNFGIYDNGYGIFDHYDLGNYFQKGTTETRFGSRSQLETMITAMHNNNIEVYADIVLNHIWAGDTEDEVNPVVKQYVFDQYQSNTHTPYPTDEIKWVIKNAAVGDYYLQVHGYHFNSTTKEERGYDLQIDYEGTGFKSYTDSDLADFTEDQTDIWVWEPNAGANNGGGMFGIFPASGHYVRGHIEQNDVDEFKFHVSSPRDVIIKLTSRREAMNPFKWQRTDQNQCFFPFKIWDGSKDIAITSQLEAHTNTHIVYPSHNGIGEKNVTWNYSRFHPVDNVDFLEDNASGIPDVIPNSKQFGNDVNTFDPTVKNDYKDWGSWLATQIKFDGFRLDFARGFQSDYVGEWVNSLPKLNGKQRFVVAEYWSDVININSWVNQVAATQADVDAFDFPLKWTLNAMCNSNQGFNMADLNHAGMVRANANWLSGTQVVTWLENHDTGKEHDKWVTKDWKMGYAYILTHEGRPCIFYNHYFGDVMIDKDDSSLKVYPDASLTADIEMLMFIRKTYLNGTLAVLSDKAENVNPNSSNPYSADGEGTSHVYVARRQGNGVKDGAIIVINNHDSAERGLWVDTAQPGFANWANTTLVNAFNPAETTQVQADGSVLVKAPSRGYAIYVKQSDYVAPPPFAGNINREIQITQDYTFIPSDLNFSGVPPFSTIKIVSVETHGDLEYNGVDVVAGGIYNVQNGSLVFNPDADLNSTFTFQVMDGNGVWSNNAYTASFIVHCTAPSTLQAQQVNPFEATFIWNPVARVPNYELQYKEVNSQSWSTWSTNLTSMKVSNLDPGVAYVAKVTSLCNSHDREYSQDLLFQTPGYCKSSGDGQKDWIEQVKLDLTGITTPNFIDNKSGSDDGYKLFIPTYGKYAAGQKYQLDVTPMGDLVDKSRYFRAWIDYNHDGVFSAGEGVMDLSSNDLSTQTSTFIIPTNAQSGTTLLRVSMEAGGPPNPCDIFGDGEVEDYRIWIRNDSDNNVVSDTNQSSNELFVYPNPGSDRITIQGEFRGDLLRVYDNNGVLKGTLTLEGVDPMIDLSPLALRANEFYYLRVNDQSTRFVKK